MKNQYKVLAEKYVSTIVEDYGEGYKKIEDILERMINARDFNTFATIAKELPDAGNHINGEHVPLIIQKILAKKLATSNPRENPHLDFYDALQHLMKIAQIDFIRKGGSNTGYIDISGWAKIAIEENLTNAKIKFNKWLKYIKIKDELYKDNPGVNIDI